MRYLFFDLEYATSKGGCHKICEFGYVLTDEAFNILDRDNLIINPNIEKKDWDYRVVRQILTRTIKEYEDELTFPYYIDKIRKLIVDADYILGHTLNGDAKALNDECKRYSLPSLDYTFYDIKMIYREYSNARKDISVVNMLKELNIVGENNVHDAETDAYNTMIELKRMVEQLNLTIEEIIELCPSSVDKTSDYTVESTERAKQLKKGKISKDDLISGSLSNRKRKRVRKKLYHLFIENVKKTKEGTGKFKDKKVSISINYEERHFNQILHIVQMVVNEGGEVNLKSTTSDIFVKYDMISNDGTIKRDSKYNYVCEANQNGSNIEIITFDEFLNILDITEEELNALEPMSIDYLLEKEITIEDDEIKKEKDKVNRIAYTIGDVLKTKEAKAMVTNGNKK